MRIFLASLVVIIGAAIGTNAINSVSKMQDAKMSRFCQSISVGSSYDQECAKYR